MENYTRGSHTVLDLKYQLVWTTKYRYQVSGGDVGVLCRELLLQILNLKGNRSITTMGVVNMAFYKKRGLNIVDMTESAWGYR